jgi:hypothetical protein
MLCAGVVTEKPLTVSAGTAGTTGTDCYYVSEVEVLPPALALLDPTSCVLE